MLYRRDQLNQKKIRRRKK